MTTICSLAVIAASLLVVQFISFSTAEEVCELPPVRGPCKGHMLRYYYDQNTETCKQFTYGGCKGNGNNFETKEECESTCQSVCHQPPKTGPCRAYIQRYYYDQRAKTCKQFTYGGCDGNENNFKTKKECKRSCQSVCELPSKTGPCRGHMPRYYYDQNTETCKEFIYGGCQGNGNNFRTKKQCERTCKSAKGTWPMWYNFWMSSLDDEHMFS